MLALQGKVLSLQGKALSLQGNAEGCSSCLFCGCVVVVSPLYFVFPSNIIKQHCRTSSKVRTVVGKCRKSKSRSPSKVRPGGLVVGSQSRAPLVVVIVIVTRCPPLRVKLSGMKGRGAARRDAARRGVPRRDLAALPYFCDFCRVLIEDFPKNRSFDHGFGHEHEVIR